LGKKKIFPISKIAEIKGRKRKKNEGTLFAFKEGGRINDKRTVELAKLKSLGVKREKKTRGEGEERKLILKGV